MQPQPHLAPLVPLRTTSGAYSVAPPPQACAPSAECKKATPVPAGVCRPAPILGRPGIHTSAIPAAAGVAVPAAVAAAPTPSHAKIQPQLERLPRFKPPSFEGLNGALPCPDSPGSTPRGGECGSKELAAASAFDEGVFATSSAEAFQAAETQIAPPRDEDHLPVSKLGQPFAKGSIVEYKSRTSGHWIVAKVEGFEESSGNYRLDVQPHAPAGRVRSRALVENMCKEADELALAQEKVTAGRSREHGSDAAASSVQPSSAREVDWSRPQSASGDQQMGKSGESDLNASRLMAENEALRKQVARLQSENEALQERLVLEAAQKDRYFSELCVIHEQQRVRASS